MMEGTFLAAPRLARDYYAQDGWQPLPCISRGGASATAKQASFLPAENQDLQKLLDTAPQPRGHANFQQEGQALSTAENSLQTSPIQASDPDLPQPASALIDGQAGVSKAVSNLHEASALKQASLSQLASAPINGQAGDYEAEFTLLYNGDGASASKQAFPLESASALRDGGQASSTAVNVDLQPTNSLEEGTFQTIEFPLPFLEALCGLRINSQQDITLLQSGLRQLADQESFEGHSAPLLKHAASPPFSSSAAHSTTSSSAQSSSLSTIPAVSVLSSSTTMSAIPTPKFLAFVKETVSSAEIPTGSPHNITSRLRAMASPWTPDKLTLPSLLVGDVPISLPISSTPKTPTFPLTTTLLLPVPARQSLAPLHPAETLGYEQPKCCFHCGHTMHSIGCGPTSTSLLGFFPLRGRNGTNQAQDSKPAVHHHGTDPARRSTRPRCKMKGELKAFRIHKATLDPG